MLRSTLFVLKVILAPNGGTVRNDFEVWKENPPKSGTSYSVSKTLWAKVQIHRAPEAPKTARTARLGHDKWQMYRETRH